MNGRDAPRWTGRRVLIALLLFFGVVAAVNGAMIWFALDSWPGRSLSDARHEGRTPAVAGASREGNRTWTG